jgi:hypothetical protein
MGIAVYASSLIDAAQYNLAALLRVTASNRIGLLCLPALLKNLSILKPSLSPGSISCYTDGDVG